MNMIARYLIAWRDASAEGDLLAVVGGVDVEAVVVYADLVVGVAGADGDLEARGEEVGDGGVEGIDGDVLEHELRLLRPQDGPDQQDGDKRYEGEY